MVKILLGTPARHPRGWRLSRGHPSCWAMAVVAALALALPASRPAAAQAPPGAAAPEAARGHAAELGLALRRLGTGARVLMVAAHPDDENTALLAALSLGHGADVGYLSLTRGEGGQNGIGPELGEPLGLLRSEELLAARRQDGAVQRFTRAYDYGFSKNAEEAFRHWPKDSLLADVVATVRRFRPDVMVVVFSGTPRDGHGQHQASGILAREAFRVAGDPTRFPEQIAAGLPAHQPSALYQSLWRGMDGADAAVATGVLDPLLGRSWHQVAMASRSRHRSQDMGQAEEPGPRAVAVQQVEAVDGVGARSPAARTGDAVATRPGADALPGAAALFAGMATTLRERAATLGEAVPAAARQRLDAALERYAAAVERARGEARLLEPGAAVPALAEAVRALDDAGAVVEALGPAAEALRFHLADEREDAAGALALAAGLTLEAVASDARVVPGQEIEVELRLWNGGDAPVRVEALGPAVPAGWTAAALAEEAKQPARPRAGELLTRAFRVGVGDDLSRPYYLELPRAGDLYRWPADVALRGLPFEPEPVRGVAVVEVAGARITLESAAAWTGVDKTVGEFRRPLLVVPSVSVRLEPATAVLPLAADAAAGDGGAGVRAIPFTVELASEAPGGASGTVRLELPAGWRAEPAGLPLTFGGEGESRSAQLTAVPPRTVGPGTYAVSALFVDGEGREHRTGYALVDYPHVRPRALFRQAEATVRAFEVAVPAGITVGYIMGAGDDGPAALQQLGIPVELLGPDVLASGDLSAYDVIVAGIRAYEFRPDLVAANDRLHDWVRAGGTFIVNYNKYEFDQGRYAPYPLTMSRPHDRVTDEEAPVELALPDHPVLTWPNRIGPADFAGWVQERGLYFAGTWDERYAAPLAMADPGEDPLRGSLLIAPLGDGTYVYTGLAFFRQLPEGVPGAYRLLANLIALAARPAPAS